jgi:hypothetical protein
MSFQDRFLSLYFLQRMKQRLRVLEIAKTCFSQGGLDFTDVVKVSDLIEDTFAFSFLIIHSQCAISIYKANEKKAAIAQDPITSYRSA